MTNSEARYYLSALWGSNRISIDERIALKMAIKALKREPECEIEKEKPITNNHYMARFMRVE